MSFSADWLGLREAADHRARARFAGTELRRFGHIVDLGCGTGSNFRFLAPELAAEQQWLCIDRDRGLLERLPQRIAESGRWTVDAESGVVDARGGTCRCAIEVREHDLSRGLPQTAGRADTLVTASALLDLVSAAWLGSAAAWCAARNVAALFALTFDGRMSCVPSDPFDTVLYALVNRHQLGDKGFGAALGPAAVEAAVDMFSARGYASLRARSDWHIGADEAALQLALVSGWCDAAAELEPKLSGRIAEWLERRTRDIEAGSLEIMVGHEDLLFLPERRQ